MIVCICHRVSDRDITREARSGCGSFAQLQEETRVATGCGACLEYAEACFQSAACESARCGGRPAFASANLATA